MRSRVTLLLCLLMLCAPATALAQSSPFGSGPSDFGGTAAPTVTATPTATTTDDGDGGLAGWQIALIFAAGAILLAGIAWAVVSDARSHAPVTETADQSESKARNEAEHKRRKQQARARERRARASRKKNRPGRR
jgi:hypothetical protein